MVIDYSRFIQRFHFYIHILFETFFFIGNSGYVHRLVHRLHDLFIDKDLFIDCMFCS